MRKTPCIETKNSLRQNGVSAVECNCCGFWEFRRMTDAHGILREYAINNNGKVVRL